MGKLVFIAFILCGIVLVSCGSDKKDQAKGKASNNSGCATQTVLADDTKGGCRIRLVTPNTCEVVDVSPGKTYELAWTTDGTTCETPWTVYFAGSPANDQNTIAYNVPTDGGAITQKGAVIQIDASAFDGLKSDNGTYHWVVKSFGGSHPASKNFVVKK